MDFKIVLDSSANVHGELDAFVTSVPLKIVAGETEYVDNASLDTGDMIDRMEAYKGKSGTACPNPEEYVEAFREHKYVFAITISSALSGSYNSALVAKSLYEERYPGRRVHVIDTLSAGPEMVLIMEKLASLIEDGKSFEEICSAIDFYQKHTHTLFALKSISNLVKNGRVSKAVAIIAGALNISLVGKASDTGNLEMTDKCRGEVKSISALVARMKEMGYNGKKVRIAHCLNEGIAMKLKNALEKEFASLHLDIQIDTTKGLCSYYAERGGLMVGFED